MNWEGAAPEVMEHDVVEPLEEAVMQVEGIKSLTSSSRQGSSNITIELFAQDQVLEITVPALPAPIPVKVHNEGTSTVVQ